MGFFHHGRTRNISINTSGFVVSITYQKTEVHAPWSHQPSINYGRVTFGSQANEYDLLVKCELRKPALQRHFAHCTGVTCEYK